MMTDESAARIVFNLLADVQHYMNADTYTALRKACNALMDKAAAESRGRADELQK